MIDGPTKELTDSDKLNLIIGDLADVKARLAGLEAVNEDRSRDTRPMLAQIHKSVADLAADMRDVKERTGRIERKFDILASDMVELRARQSDVEARVDLAERRPS